MTSGPPFIRVRPKAGLIGEPGHPEGSRPCWTENVSVHGRSDVSVDGNIHVQTRREKQVEPETWIHSVVVRHHGSISSFWMRGKSSVKNRRSPGMNPETGLWFVFQSGSPNVVRKCCWDQSLPVQTLGMMSSQRGMFS